MTETFNAQQIQAFDLQKGDILGSETLDGLGPIVWREIEEIDIYPPDAEGNRRNFVKMVLEGDHYSATYDEWVLIKPRGEGSDERYSREDIENAVRIADMRSGDRIVEYAEVARSQRLGYIRKTKAKLLTTLDNGKWVRIKNEIRAPQLLTSFMTFEAYPHRVFLVVDGYIHDVMNDDDIWIDDNSTPEDKN